MHDCIKPAWFDEQAMLLLAGMGQRRGANIAD
jgi:hypothetical protein